VTPTFISGEDLARALSFTDAVEALERALLGEMPHSPPRSVMHVAGADLLVMPAAGPQGTGVKLVTVNPLNPPRGLPLIHALYALFAPGTLEPAAIFDGEALTSLRTGAVSALATKHLAPPSATHLVLFGAGTQARAHLEAMRAVRPIERVTVVSRGAERAAALVDDARAAGLEAGPGDPGDAAAADIVCTCTTSSAPLFPGAILKEGAHVNAVGAYRPEARELDDACVRRARIVVESRTAALTEAGDLLIPLAAGAIDPTWIVADLQELVRGEFKGREGADVTVFKSVGAAFEDLVVAAAAYERLAA